MSTGRKKTSAATTPAPIPHPFVGESRETFLDRQAGDREFPKPPRPLPERPSGTASLLISDLPDDLVPTIPNAKELVKVGEVCGYEVHARRELVEQAAEIQKRMGGKKWPSDALRATILALRMGLKPTPTYREVAVMLNMSERHVLRMIRASKTDDSVQEAINRIDREGLPMATENLLEGLESRDKDYTKMVLEGRGVLNPKGAAASGAPPPVFAGLVVRFEHEGNVNAEVKVGTIIANEDDRVPEPKVIQGAVVERA
jgi:hypothetical protein